MKYSVSEKVDLFIQMTKKHLNPWAHYVDIFLILEVHIFTCIAMVISWQHDRDNIKTFKIFLPLF